MAKTVDEETLRQFAIDYSEEIKASAYSSGDIEEIAMLHDIQEKLGESKILNDPKFFYWKFKYLRQELEICGYDVDEADHSIMIFVSDFGEPYKTILQAEATKIVKGAIEFAIQCVNRNKSFINILENEAYDFYDDIQTMNNSPKGISKFKIVIVSNGKRSARARTEMDPIGDIDVELFYWDIEWIYSNCNSVVEMEDIIIDAYDEDFKDIMDGGIPCLPVPQPDNQFECYQCVVPGALLSKVYRKFGSLLLEGNVRSFLTTKTAVNTQIQKTIQSEPKRFYVYNNGIAAIAASVTVEKSDGMSRITRIEKIQIVNGGQTTASLAYSAQKRGADLADISVPMKLTVIKADSDEKQNDLDILIQKISETSNSQNKVSAVDFFANHPFHMKMKKFSETLSQPGLNYSTNWFYERARGEYKQALLFKTKAQSDHFLLIHPKEKLVTKTEFLKYLNLMNKRPDQVSKGGDSNFKILAADIKTKWDVDQAKYNELFFKKVVSTGYIYRQLEPEITKKKATWFGGSYRANILAYAISAMFWIVERTTSSEFDLLKIWDKGLTDDFKADLLDLCKKVYELITSPDRPVENVTQYCKQEACWHNVQKGLRHYYFPADDLSYYLISHAESHEAEKEAKKDEAINDEIDFFSKIDKAPYKNNWKAMMSFLLAHEKEFPNFTRNIQTSVLRVVNLSMGRFSQMPTTHDFNLAFEWWDKAIALGWKI